MLSPRSFEPHQGLGRFFVGWVCSNTQIEGGVFSHTCSKGLAVLVVVAGRVVLISISLLLGLPWLQVLAVLDGVVDIGQHHVNGVLEKGVAFSKRQKRPTSSVMSRGQKATMLYSSIRRPMAEFRPSAQLSFPSSLHFVPCHALKKENITAEVSSMSRLVHFLNTDACF